MIDSDDQLQYDEAHAFKFSEKTRLEGISEYLTYLRKEAGTFLATAVSLWAFAETVSAATHARASIEHLALPVLVFAAAAAAYRAYRKREEYVPDALAFESARAKQIYKRQRLGWNAALAREMISTRLDPVEAVLDRLHRGAEYVAPQRLDDSEYYEWLVGRLPAIRRLMRATMVLLTQDVLAAVARTTSEKDLKRLCDEIDALGRLYNEARDLEQQSYRIAPPTKFAEIHQLTAGWTDTIRKSVGDFCSTLDEVAELDRQGLIAGTVPSPQFFIKVGAPPNLDEFAARLQALAASDGSA